MATTGVCYSFKQEGPFSAGHSFLATISNLATTNTSGTPTLTVSSTAGINIGMNVSGTGVPSGAVVIGLTATTVTLSANTTAAVTAATFTGDTFKMLLIKASPSLTYGPTQTNVGTPSSGTPSTSNVGTDETSGTGYTSGGVALGNVAPSLSGSGNSVATVSFSPNPSWTSATFSATAGIIYNTSTRLGAAAAPLNGRTVSVHDFGGTQSVSSGTFTVLMPTNSGTTAILSVS